MSTNATIVTKLENDKGFMAIYLHWDGYPDHTFNMLINHYNTQESVDELMLLGDLSSIDYTIGTCVAYHRDKKEHLDCCFLDNYNDIPDIYSSSEYDYLWDGEKWTYTERY